MKQQTLIKLGLGIIIFSGVMALTFIGCGGSSGSSGSSDVTTLTLNTIVNKSVNEGLPLTFTVLATGPAGATITYTMVSTPTITGATLISNTGAFSWRPNYSQADTYSVEFKAETATLDDSQVMTITVNNIPFGSNGFISANKAAGGYGEDYGYAMTVTALGKILVTGSSQNSDGNYDMAIWCYNADGTPDTSFGSGNGFVVFDGEWAIYDERGYAITLDGDGKILVAGYISNGNDDDMALWRYTITGTLDTAFNSTGFVLYDGGNTWGECGYAITLDANDKILVAGYISNGNDDDMAIWRYTSAGALDTAFNSTGYVVYAGGGSGFDYGKDIITDADGNILVAGYSYNGTNADMAVWRYDDTGAPDPAFSSSGTAGLAIYNGASNKSDMGTAIAIDASGKIMVAGLTEAGSDYDMALWRYTITGTLDTAFNTDGVVTHTSAAGGSSNDYGQALAIDGSGNILVAGYSYNALGNTDMAIWRYDSTGALDTAFSTTGIAVHDGANGLNSTEEVYGLAIDANGKIMAVGSSRESYGNDYALAIWRYTITGTLDTSFSADGFLVKSSTAGGYGDDEGSAVIIDAQGRILVTGSSHNYADYDDMFIRRYNGDGTLDTTFGVNGAVSYDGEAHDDDRGEAITLDADGNILVAGSIYAATGGDMAIWRYTSAGALDTTFSSDGVVTHSSAAGAVGFDPDGANAIAVDADGKILVTGQSLNASGNYDMVIWRYTITGTLDTTFGSPNGYVTYDAGFSGSDFGRAITTTADGNILVAGYGDTGPNDDMIIWRYTVTGTLDTTFGGGDGIVTYNGTGNGGDWGYSLAVDALGNILVGGSSYTSGLDFDMAIWRYTITGTLDATFGTGGVVTHHDAAGGDGNDFSYGGLALDADGNILITGWSYNGSSNDMALWRYDDTGALDNTFDTDGIVTHNGTGSGAGARDLVLDAGGNIIVVGGSGTYMVIWRYLAAGSLDADSE